MIIENYNMIYNNYCISYLSHNSEIPTILCLIRKNLERSFPELKIFYAFNNKMVEFFSKQKNVISYDCLVENKNKFGCIFECKENLKTHPLLPLFNNLKINFEIDKEPLPKNNSRKCLLISKNIHMSLPENKIRKLKEYILSKGYEVIKDNDLINYNNINCVAGLASAEIFLAAYKGLETFLVDEGYSKDIYNKIFPKNIIFNP
jgi:hypothetical protein